MRFRTTVLLGGKTATGLQVPDDVVDGLGGGRRPAVQVTIAGYTYRTSVAARGGMFLIPLSAENRTAANVKAGDEVDVDIELDTEPRVVTVPDDLAAAFNEDSEARGRTSRSWRSPTATSTSAGSSLRNDPRPANAESARR
jgi:hypothetical protein